MLTEVIDNELDATGRQFELTPRARRTLVGLDGTQEVELALRDVAAVTERRPASRLQTCSARA